MDFSQLKMISIGIVADDKVDGERYVEVYPIELLPFVEGDISSEMFSVTRTGLDFNNNKYSITLHRALTVKADWIGETHRVTSPNVMKGEQVKLYTVGSGERYYWEPLGRDDHLRTTETVTYAFAAREKGNTPITADDCYTITVDSKNKHITLQTSKVDGEYCRYTAQLNLADGNITTMDDLGNVTQIDSKNTKMTAKNADGTFFTLNKKNLELYAPNDFIQKIDHDVKITVGNDWIENVGGEKQVYVKKDSKEFVDGTKSLIVKGDVIEAIDGDKIINVEGSITESVTGDITTDVWNESGKLQFRGRGKKMFCMARVGDSGAYKKGNVYICTNFQNWKDLWRNKPDMAIRLLLGKKQRFSNRTHCSNGHERETFGRLSPDGKFVCRKCNNIACKKYYEKNA